MQLTGALIGWPLFILWALVLLAFTLGSIGLFWGLRELLRLVAERYVNWQESKSQGSDESGDDGGHPIKVANPGKAVRSEPFWRER
jgi:uncharacterized membrane protein YdjX (TVP38/TMEM64 family)